MNGAGPKAFPTRESFMILAAIMIVAATPARAQPAAPPGVTACSGCHGPGTVGTVVPTLQGREPGEIVAAMQAFRTGRRPATVMDRIAKGFSEEEIRAIAAWIGRQR
ncbi:c-type cytochrome [Microvirga sp. GCM10011540]|uniref:c-type cytochrome n=1 Tax=Microvirga sp. GCM10011540 TaxID=3317338 RepID=UPI00360FAC29